MKYRLATGARPQAKTLLFAAAISVAVWFIPFAEILAYPFRIFVTFIHEGATAHKLVYPHALKDWPPLQALRGWLRAEIESSMKK